MGCYKMNTQELINTAIALVACDKGLLAMDESYPTCNKRFAKLMQRSLWNYLMVDGVLVGGDSLTVESFNKIIHYSSAED